ncbi:MAG TPA: hypothetical protein VGO00_19400 [Kofleriaceae bacterium]|nr:hypothetical protein [Kofleriaceae bacterium]
MTVLCVLLGSATAHADAGASVPWSDSVIDRPLTLPAGQMAIYGDLDVFKFDSGGLTATSELVHGGFGYGVTDLLTLGVDYAFNLHSSSSFMIGGTSSSSSDTFPGNGRGPLIPYASIRIAHGPLSVAASAGLVVDLAGDESIDSMGNTTFSATYSIVAGAVVKYNVAPNVSIYTGAPLGGNGIGFAGSPFGPGPLGNQIEIPLSSDPAGDSRPSTLTLPLGVGIQASPQFFAFLQTTLLGAYIANAPMGADNPIFIGSDSDKGGLGIPLIAGAFFSATHELELGLTLSFPDLQHAGDFYLFGLAARFYPGK